RGQSQLEPAALLRPAGRDRHPHLGTETGRNVSLQPCAVGQLQPAPLPADAAEQPVVAAAVGGEIVAQAQRPRLTLPARGGAHRPSEATARAGTATTAAGGTGCPSGSRSTGGSGSGRGSTPPRRGRRGGPRRRRRWDGGRDRGPGRDGRRRRRPAGGEERGS